MAPFDSGKTFTVASDPAMIELIMAAKRRLVVVAPAFSLPVANALIARFGDRPTLQMTVVMDADAEVYRLGYGDETALDRLHKESLENDFALRKQAGVRIGLIVSDDATMIFAPTPQLIEAGSKTPEKPNALVIRGDAVGQIAAAAGADETAPPGRREIGETPVKKEELAEAKQSLKDNPVQPFDISRALRVFSSKVQYVEFEAKGYKLDRKVVPLPEELMDVADTALRDQMSARIRSPLKDLKAVEIELERDGKKKKVKVDGTWLDAERKRIEDTYLYAIPGYGKIILHKDREAFEKATSAFCETIELYIAAVKSKIEGRRVAFIKSVIKEYGPRWKRRPPASYAIFGVTPTPETIKEDLTRIAGDLFDRTVNFAPPRVSVVPKNIAPESLRDGKFKEKVEAAFRKRRAPESLIQSLFENFDAARGSGPLFKAKQDD